MPNHKKNDTINRTNGDVHCVVASDTPTLIPLLKQYIKKHAGIETSQLNFKVTLNNIDADADFETLLVEATNDVGITNTIRADVTIQIQNIS